MHLHASALDFLVFAAYLLIAQFLLKQVAFRYPESAVGKAILVLVG